MKGLPRGVSLQGEETKVKRQHRWNKNNETVIKNRR